MKCPNCRCIVPNNQYECSYCGYAFSSGSAKTLTINEANEDYLYYLYHNQPVTVFECGSNHCYSQPDFESVCSDGEGIFVDNKSLLMISAVVIIVLLLLQMFLLLI